MVLILRYSVIKRNKLNILEIIKSEYITEDVIFKKDKVFNQNCLFSMTPYLYDEFCLI